MTKTQRIRENLLAMFPDKWEIMEGTVNGVNEGELLVDVEIAEGITLFDIKLRAVANGGNAGLVCVPKVGSEIVFGKIRGQDDFVLIQASELEKVITEIGITKMVISSSGYEITRGGQNLLAALSDFIAEVQKIIVIDGTTPNVPALEAINTRLKTILK